MRTQPLVLKSGIERSLAIRHVVIIFLIFSTFSLIQYLKIQKEESLDLKINAEKTLNSLVTALIHPRWNFADLEEDQILSLTMANKDIVSVILFDENNHVLNAYTKDELQNIIQVNRSTDISYMWEDELDRNRFLKSSAIVYESQVIGKVLVVFSKTEMINRLNGFLIYSFSVAIGLGLITLIFLHFTVNRMLIKPISKMLEFTKETSRRNFDKELKIKQENEIGELADSLNEMNFQLKNTFEDLNEAKTKAETSNEAKSNFISIMNHELRTPLNAIIGFSDILLERDLSKGDRRDVEFIRDAGIELNELVSDILNITALDRRHIYKHEENVCINDFIYMNAIVPFQNKAKARNLKIHYDIDDGMPPFLEFDYELFKIVLRNFMSNALKFTKEGQIAVYCKLEDSNQASCLSISVEDSGVGIPEEEIPLILQPFYQVDMTSKKRLWRRWNRVTSNSKNFKGP